MRKYLKLTLAILAILLILPIFIGIVVVGTDGFWNGFLMSLIMELSSMALLIFVGFLSHIVVREIYKLKDNA